MNENLAISIHKQILKSKQDDWRGNRIKEKQIRIAIKKSLSENDIKDESEVERIFKLVLNQNEY